MITNVKKINTEGVFLKSYRVTLNDGTVMSVPLDEANTDYQKILQWVADGNTIQEAD